MVRESVESVWQERLPLKVPPTHRRYHRPYPLPTHWPLTTDYCNDPPAAPTQRPLSDPVATADCAN